MRKWILSFAVFLCLSLAATAQVGINPSNDPPAPSAGVDVDFTNRGFLQPRLTAEQISAISNPAAGLMVFNLSSGKPIYFDGVTWRNYDGTSSWSGCGDPIEVIHIGGPAAPVSKSVSYGTVTGIPGEPDKCWITSNLGSDRQASAMDDATEASAGWYWQFNRSQGYKHDGTNRTPNTGWITGTGENSNWTAMNDPCAIELGGRWRIPTGTEWKNIDVGTGSNWSNWNGPWSSPLKLHAAGSLNGTDGAITLRGTEGRYWGNGSSAATDAWMFRFSNQVSYADSAYQKTWGGSVRCIQCPEPTTPVSPSAGSHTVFKTRIIWRWNAVTGAAGYNWNTTDNYFTAIDMLDSLSVTEYNLNYCTAYTRYIWTYDSCGGYSNPVALNDTTLALTCNTDSLYISHVAGDVAPVSKIVAYATANGIPGEPDKCWITSNLGANHQATAVDDTTEASAGWYWQFNRKQGYRVAGTTVTPAWNFTIVDEDSDWMPANDPCMIELGAGWRIPTSTEWFNVDQAGGWVNRDGPWNSVLKMHAAGYINYFDGSLQNRGIAGAYSTGNQEDSSNSKVFYFDNNVCSLSQGNKTHGLSVRCIQP